MVAYLAYVFFFRRSLCFMNVFC